MGLKGNGQWILSLGAPGFCNGWWGIQSLNFSLIKVQVSHGGYRGFRSRMWDRGIWEERILSHQWWRWHRWIWSGSIPTTSSLWLSQVVEEMMTTISIVIKLFIVLVFDGCLIMVSIAGNVCTLIGVMRISESLSLQWSPCFGDSSSYIHPFHDHLYLRHIWVSITRKKHLN